MNIIQILIEDLRVNINTFGKNGLTPFHEVCNLGNLDIINLFVSSNRKIDFEKKQELNIIIIN